MRLGQSAGRYYIPDKTPSGPYADKFSEKQHKYGPFKPIAMAALNNKSTKPRFC
jgi:hypothetical protein